MASSVQGFGAYIRTMRASVYLEGHPIKPSIGLKIYRGSHTVTAGHTLFDNGFAIGSQSTVPSREYFLEHDHGVSFCNKLSPAFAGFLKARPSLMIDHPSLLNRISIPSFMTGPAVPGSVKELIDLLNGIPDIKARLLLLSGNLCGALAGLSEEEQLKAGPFLLYNENSVFFLPPRQPFDVTLSANIVFEGPEEEPAQRGMYSITLVKRMVIWNAIYQEVELLPYFAGHLLETGSS